MNVVDSFDFPFFTPRPVLTTVMKIGRMRG